MGAHCCRSCRAYHDCRCNLSHGRKRPICKSSQKGGSHMNPLKRIEALEKQVSELLAHLPMLAELKAEYERFKSERESVHKNNNLIAGADGVPETDPTQPQKGATE